jgi:UrcA family protein
MEDQMISRSRILFGAAAIGIFASSAFAQSIQSNGQPIERVVVVAPYLVTEKPAPATQSTPRQKLFTVSLLGEANYGDLDLSKEEGAAKLKERVHDTATQLCNRIEKQYPSAVYVPVGNQDCVKAAVDDAMTAVNVLITAYHRS